MYRSLPFPFPGGVFPEQLGAVVQRTVLDGREPAREVAHYTDGSWSVADGVHDPNEPGGSVAAHLSHVLVQNSSVHALATLPPGHLARRNEPGDEWIVMVLDESEESLCQD